MKLFCVHMAGVEDDTTGHRIGGYVVYVVARNMVDAFKVVAELGGPAMRELIDCGSASIIPPVEIPIPSGHHAYSVRVGIGKFRRSLVVVTVDEGHLEQALLVALEGKGVDLQYVMCGAWDATRIDLSKEGLW